MLELKETSEVMYFIKNSDATQSGKQCNSKVPCLYAEGAAFIQCQPLLLHGSGGLVLSVLKLFKRESRNLDLNVKFPNF